MSTLTMKTYAPLDVKYNQITLGFDNVRAINMWRNFNDGDDVGDLRTFIRSLIFTERERVE